MLVEYLDYRGNTNREINGLLRMGLKFKHKLMKLQVTESKVQNPWRGQNVSCSEVVFHMEGSRQDFLGEIKYSVH